MAAELVDRRLKQPDLVCPAALQTQVGALGSEPRDRARHESPGEHRDDHRPNHPGTPRLGEPSPLSAHPTPIPASTPATAAGSNMYRAAGECREAVERERDLDQHPRDDPAGEHQHHAVAAPTRDRDTATPRRPQERQSRPANSATR